MSFSDNVTKQFQVAVTGLGLITPLGVGVDKSWNNLLSGMNCCKVDPFLNKLDINISCRIPDFDPCDILGKSLTRRVDRFIQLALIAAREAIKDANIDISKNPSRVGVVVGNSLAGTDMFCQELSKLEQNTGIISASTIPGSMINMVAGQIAIDCGAKGASLVVSTACASGTSALGMARELIRTNQCDIVIAGATEAPITPIIVAGMSRLGALSRNTQCEIASKPFDIARDGFVIAEGAGFVILEKKENAKKRNAKVYSYISGYGSSTDAYHVTTPEPSGSGLYDAIQLSLNDASISINDIQHINAHGTSTKLNDITESIVINKLFKDTEHPAVTSIKGAIGHTLAASGAIESIFTMLSIHHSIIPHTLNLTSLDPDINLDIVQGKPRHAVINHALKTSLGFGGHNAALIITKEDSFSNYQ